MRIVSPAGAGVGRIRAEIYIDVTQGYATVCSKQRTRRECIDARHARDIGMLRTSYVYCVHAIIFNLAVEDKKTRKSRLAVVSCGPCATRLCVV